jgi:hypothetical protein
VPTKLCSEFFEMGVKDNCFGKNYFISALDLANNQLVADKIWSHISGT